jgi:putative hydrolase
MEEPRFEIDVHTHTLASGHAYSTMQEMVAAARAKGMKGLGITEHAPKMTGSCKEIYFRNLRIVPRDWDGLTVLLGVELNIYDDEGHVDLSEDTLRKLDVRIASVHTNVYPPTTKKQLANAVRGALANPYVDILGHPDDGRYEYDPLMIAELAAEHNKIVEINNSSLRPTGVRENAYENDLKLLECCKRYRVPILMGSDAHIALDVGAHELAQKVIADAGYPQELVLNYHMEQLLAILREHKMFY